jgi:hypothetical protein
VSIALLTFTGDLRELPEFEEMLRLVLPNREAYCARHGYEHWVWTGSSYLDADEYYAVNRLRYLRDRFVEDERVELAWVLNVAAVITNPLVRIEEFVDDDAADVFITRAPNGALHAASLVVRRSAWSIGWLSDMIERANTVHRDHPWHENQAMIDSEAACGPKMRVLPHPSIDQLHSSRYRWPSDAQDWKPGDFVVTFSGLPLNVRVALVREALAE